MKTINEILAQFEYDTSVEAYEASPMVKMLQDRPSDTPSFLDKYKD